MVREWATRRRRAAAPSSDLSATVLPVPPGRTIARLLTKGRDCRFAEALRVRVAVETTSPRIVAARNLLDRLRTKVAAKVAAKVEAKVAAKRTDGLAAWLEEAAGSDLASFASGVRDDEAAVRSAIVQPWSNGQTEGQLSRLKLVKRQMYGRANVDLLRARMVQPA